MPLPSKDISQNQQSSIDFNNLTDNELPYVSNGGFYGSKIFDQDGFTIFQKTPKIESNVLNLGGLVDIIGSGTRIGFNNKLTDETGLLLTHGISKSSQHLIPRFPVAISQILTITLNDDFADELPASVSYEIDALIDKFSTNSDRDIVISKIRLKLFTSTTNLKLRISTIDGKIIRSLPSEYSFVDGSGMSFASGDVEIDLNSVIHIKNGTRLKIDFESSAPCLLGTASTGIPYTTIDALFTYSTPINNCLIPRTIFQSSEGNAIIKPNTLLMTRHNVDNQDFNITFEDGYNAGDVILILFSAITDPSFSMRLVINSQGETKFSTVIKKELLSDTQIIDTDGVSKTFIWLGGTDGWILAQ